MKNIFLFSRFALVFVLFFFTCRFTFADYQNNADYIHYKATYTNALAENYVSIVPIKYDLTDYDELKQMQGWDL